MIHLLAFALTLFTGMYKQETVSLEHKTLYHDIYPRVESLMRQKGFQDRIDTVPSVVYVQVVNGINYRMKAGRVCVDIHTSFDMTHLDFLDAYVCEV